MLRIWDQGRAPSCREKSSGRGDGAMAMSRDSSEEGRPGRGRQRQACGSYLFLRPRGLLVAPPSACSPPAHEPRAASARQEQGEIAPPCYSRSCRRWRRHGSRPAVRAGDWSAGSLSGVAPSRRAGVRRGTRCDELEGGDWLASGPPSRESVGRLHPQRALADPEKGRSESQYLRPAQVEGSLSESGLMVGVR